MKRKVVVLVLIAVLFHPLWAQTEDDFTVGLTEDGTGVVIKAYTGKEVDVRIPATIQGMPVKEIKKEDSRGAQGPFASSSITSVVIPEGVTLIGENSFDNCKLLTSVTLPNTLTVIDRSVFSRCSVLTSITIPESVTTIGSSAFSSSGLTSITWPSGIATVSASVFSE